MSLPERSTIDTGLSSSPPAASARRLQGLLEWAYGFSVRRSFIQLLSGIVVAAILLATALSVPIWGTLYGVSGVPVIVVTFIVALFTATPLAGFLVYVIKKAEHTRAALETSNSILTQERETQAKTLRELRVARDEAHAANHAKTQFLANMSHELRTPLNAVIGFSEMIANEMMGPAGKPEYVGYAKSINESGAHLLALINDILDVSRIEAGGYDLNEQRIDVASCARSAQQLIETRAKSAEITLRCDVPADLPWLYCDPRAVKQMLLNLLTNAVSFTPSGGSVTVTAREKPLGGISIAVSDTGVGMTEAEIPYALARFSQVDNSHARTHHGAGLGLPLTRDLIALHGGTLEIDSTPDVGTTVTLTFPPERSRKS